MDTVINVGFRLEWDHPVFVRNGLFDDRSITGPREALKYLETGFSIRSGHSYWAAVSACSSALLYRCHLEQSRDCFVVAYAEYMCKIGAR
jgi:hypothetical protein